MALKRLPYKKLAPLVRDYLPEEEEECRASALCELGNVFRASNRSEEAVVAYKQALAIDPTHSGACFNLGLAYVDAGDFSRAAEDTFTSLGLDGWAERGVLSMARASDPDSASSQFFIVVKDSPFLDKQYTVFGEVVKGMEVVDRIVSESSSDTSDPRSGGKPRVYQKILKVELVEQAPDKA